MNQALKEAIFKQKIRANIRTALRSKILTEEASLYTTFVQPFTDVLSAVNLGAQEILNSTFTLFQLLFTWDPEKAREKLRKHDERKAKIAEKWKPLMERTDDALSSGDADIVALTFAPGVYALSSVGGKAYDAAEGMGTFLNNTGLKAPFLGALIPGYDTSDDTAPKEDKIDNLLGALEKLFIGAAVVGSIGDIPDAIAKKMSKKESTSKKNHVILEASGNDFLSDFNQYLEDTGIIDEINKTRDELVESLKESVKEFDDDFEVRKKVFEDIKAATSMEEFEKAIAGIEEIDGQLNSQKIKTELDKAAKELSSNEKFKSTAEKEGKKELSDTDLQNLALKVVFEDAKKGLSSRIEEGLDTYRKEAGKILEEMLPSEKALVSIKKSKEGIKFADFVEKTKRKYEIS